MRSVDTPQYHRPRAQPRFRHDHQPAGASRCRPATSSAAIWGSAAADEPSSRNYAGIKNPAVDKLIERVIYATDRDELVAATKALDRVLLWNHYVIPQFYTDVYRIARWDRFGHPGEHPGLHAGLSRHLVVGRGEGRRRIAAR